MGHRMRVMFSCTAGQGHFRPLVPLARAFENAGHEVMFVTAASFAGNVGAAGFDLLPAGIGRRELEERYAPFKARTLQMQSGERRTFSFKWRFGLIEAPAKLPGLRAAVDTWVPDLLVHESADLAAPLVAASQGIPTVHHAFGRLVPTICFEHAAEETSHLSSLQRWGATTTRPRSPRFLQMPRSSGMSRSHFSFRTAR